MSRTIAIMLPALILSSLLNGQRSRSPGMQIEAGAGVNLSYFDVGGGSPGVSLQGSALFNLHPSWRLGVNAGFHRARGTDDGTVNSARGYAFKSNLNEISVRGLYLLHFNQRQRKKWMRNLEPRAFAGLGVLQIQPVQNRLLASGSDGGGMNVAPLFSAGIGLACSVRNDLSLLLEGGTNLSSSDYLEGYTSTLNSDWPDMFHAIMIKAIYKVPL